MGMAMGVERARSGIGFPEIKFLQKPSEICRGFIPVFILKNFITLPNFPFPDCLQRLWSERHKAALTGFSGYSAKEYLPVFHIDIVAGQSQ